MEQNSIKELSICLKINQVVAGWRDEATKHCTHIDNSVLLPIAYRLDFHTIEPIKII